LKYEVLADLVVGLHLTFVIFVVLGGLLVLRWWWLAFFHIPAAVWGILIEFAGWVCPLTPLEQSLRARAGEAGYPGGFIEHYLLPVLYPAGLTQGVQLFFGSLVIAVNLVIYGLVLWRRVRSNPALISTRGRSG
jgi:cytochrome b subunit of formate dehydrogenase